MIISSSPVGTQLQEIKNDSNIKNVILLKTWTAESISIKNIANWIDSFRRPKNKKLFSRYFVYQQRKCDKFHVEQKPQERRVHVTA